MKLRLLLTALSITVLSFVSAQSGNAQEVDTSLVQPYYAEIERYREAEAQFNIDKAEYKQVQTLVSKEKAVTSFRELLTARARVLESYNSTLIPMVRQAPAVDEAQRQLTLAKLNDSNVYLNSYQQQAQGIVELEQANELSKSFETNVESTVFNSQYRALSLLAISQVQTQFNQLETYISVFENQYIASQPESSVKEFLERGMAQIDLQVATVVQALELAKTGLDGFEVTGRGAKTSQANYNAVTKALQPTIGSMKRAISFLSELERQPR